jgi:hypothetical protein
MSIDTKNATRVSRFLCACGKMFHMTEHLDLNSVIRSRRAAVGRVRARLAAACAPESSGFEVDDFLSARTGYWESTMSEDGPPVRRDLSAALQQLRRRS